MIPLEGSYGSIQPGNSLFYYHFTYNKLAFSLAPFIREDGVSSPAYNFELADLVTCSPHGLRYSYWFILWIYIVSSLLMILFW